MSTLSLPNSISKTISQLFSLPFRKVLGKSIGLTVAMLIGLWMALQTANETLLAPSLAAWPWAVTAVAWVLGAGLILGLGFLIAPVTSIFAGVFLDDIADEVERTHYPQDTPGKVLSLRQSVGMTVRFLGLVLVGNFVALILVLFLGLGVLVFFVLNGYLLGREYFQFAALRHLPLSEVNSIRERHGLEIFLAGLAIAVVLSIPLVNLLTPLFAGALMVHVYKRLEQQQLAD